MPKRFIEDVLPLGELNKYAQKGGGIGYLNAMHPYFARCPLTASATRSTPAPNWKNSTIPADRRIVTIEEEAELRLGQENVVTLERRPLDRAGKGGISVKPARFLPSLRIGGQKTA